MTNQVWWNEGIRTLFGYPLEEVGPDSNWWSKNIHPDHFARVTSSIHAAIESGGEQWKDEYPFRRHDGTYIFVEDRGHIVRDACGKGVRMVGAMIDITNRRRAEEERRKLESQIQHAQKLESLGILAGGIAHDFNNLLTGMLGNASLALAELRPDSPARESVRQIEITAVRAAELTRQMLAYSGKGRFLVEPLNLSHLVEEMAHLLGTVISKRAILRFDFMPNLPLIKADATQIRQVFMNLITNASDAIGDKSGIIAVRTGVMHTDDSYMSSTTTDDELTPGFYVFAEISDTGCGMDEATVSKIFDPFFTTKFTGRGLGLAAVLGIVRGHRGAIKVYSEPGRGTTFKVLFPCAEGETVKEECSVHSMGPWNGSGTILVVDDDESVRAVARKTLEQRGFRVLIAPDGMEGVEMFAEHQENIVAVLLDLTMPRMGGVEAFRELRRIRPDVRTVLMSGYNEEEVANQFLGKGLAGFLQKPFRATELIRVIRQAIEK
ncbi:MAG: response regulator [Planctomycetota bacterium]